ncbi:3-deoxy-manno-octulosonate cytidylyltransferase [Bombella intestini]|uniref:3-deoxy-manno-octulosonate cytidylyltransferase n=1 Tax=Bombella intestini TaxID=1539051 RepID=A0A1S8GRT4_9PROT|nr:3-deoxy-manno-octulosonate cytidylyltransferase [Bombella intestini]OOL19548.1 3-deoxy-manno-octulosonate cytidylyltransferase [Bombella intestini]
MRPIIVIPSRIASTRLPRKALAEIDGEAMVVHVARRAVAAGLGPVLVAAGDEEIRKAVAGMAGVEALLTDPALPSGSDRVQAALKAYDPQGQYDCVINLQGDLPLVEPTTLRQALRPLEEGQFDIGTLVAPVQSLAERDADSVVKVACTFRNDEDVARALYFSRSVIPWGEGAYWHHVGVYAWRCEALARFVTLPPSGLEVREKLEQLRALEAGMTIGCARIETAPLGVDTPEDLARVRASVREQALCQ